MTRILAETAFPIMLQLNVSNYIVGVVDDLCKQFKISNMFIMGRGSSFHGGWNDDSDIDVTVVYHRSVFDYCFNKQIKNPGKQNIDFVVDDVKYSLEVRFMDFTDLTNKLQYGFDYNSVDLFLSSALHVKTKYYGAYWTLHEYVTRQLLTDKVYYNAFVSQSLKLIHSLVYKVDKSTYVLLYLNLLRLMFLKENSFENYDDNIDIRNMNIGCILRSRGLKIYLEKVRGNTVRGVSVDSLLGKLVIGFTESLSYPGDLKAKLRDLFIDYPEILVDINVYFERGEFFRISDYESLEDTYNEVKDFKNNGANVSTINLNSLFGYLF